MVITGVKIRLLLGGNENLLAIASILLDDMMVVKDIKIIRTNEKMFVAMPSRKATDRCQKCKCKNNVDAKFCNKCGAHLSFSGHSNTSGKQHADIAHPITIDFRKQLENTVLQAYAAEVEISKVPGYRPAMDSGFDVAVVAYVNELPAESSKSARLVSAKDTALPTTPVQPVTTNNRAAQFIGLI